MHASTWKGRTCNGATNTWKKCHMKVRKNETFQRPSLCYFSLMYFWLCYILYMILHSHSWIVPHYRQSKSGALASGKTRDFISFPPLQPLSHCLGITKRDCIWIICQVFDKTQNTAGLFRHWRTMSRKFLVQPLGICSIGIFTL